MIFVDEGKDLKRIREQLRLTQAEMAEKLGVSRSRYKNWEYDLASPPTIIREKLRQYEAGESRRDKIKSLVSMPMAQIPLVGKASAGLGASTYADEEMLAVPLHMAREGAYGMIVEGDSMLPWLEPGDIVVALTHSHPRLNYAFLVRRPDGDVSVKVLKWASDQIVMRSLNPQYQDEPVHGTLMGFVIGIYRVDGTHETMSFDPSGLRPPNF